MWCRDIDGARVGPKVKKKYVETNMRNKRARKVDRYLYFLGWRKAGEKDIEKSSCFKGVRLLMRGRDMQTIELRRE